MYRLASGRPWWVNVKLSHQNWEIKIKTPEKSMAWNEKEIFDGQDGNLSVW